MRSPWVTIQGTTRREVRAKQNREGNQAVKQLIWAGAIGAKILLSSNGKGRICHYRHSQKRNAPDYQAAQKQLEMELHVPNQNAMGGIIMDEFDRKVIAAFPGKSVRKDLTSLMKKGANVPTYVLEYLLGMYCATDDEDAIKTGLEKIKKILSENYVRPDQSDYVKSKIKENGQYTVIDKVTVRLDESEDKYVASFTNLDLQDFEVNSDLVTHNEKLLIGGIWCIIKIEYVGLEKEDDEEEEYEEDIFDGNKKKRGRKRKKKKSKYESPFTIAALKPIQMANLDLDEIFEARKQFTKDEWITLLLRSAGYEPKELSEKQKLHYLLRFVPFPLWTAVPVYMISSILLWLLAPVETSHKPLDELEQRVYRHRARLIWCVESLVMIGLFFLQLEQAGNCILLSMAALSVMLAAGKFQLHHTHQA